MEISRCSVRETGLLIPSIRCVANGFDPLTAGEQAQDPDADGLDNLGEQAAGTDPHDADSDDFSDGEEVTAGSDPLSPFSFPGFHAVPALGPWGIGVVVALLGAVGVRQSRRRVR